jgi:hypothetical protein
LITASVGLSNESPTNLNIFHPAAILRRMGAEMPMGSALLHPSYGVVCSRRNEELNHSEVYMQALNRTSPWPPVNKCETVRKVHDNHSNISTLLEVWSSNMLRDGWQRRILGPPLLLARMPDRVPLWAENLLLLFGRSFACNRSDSPRALHRLLRRLQPGTELRPGTANALCSGAAGKTLRKRSNTLSMPVKKGPQDHTVP